MFVRVLRVIFGFLVACVAAGLTLVLFVYTPAELANLSSNAAPDRLSEVGLLALATATHSAIFAAPLALIGAGIAEWRGIANWTYYVSLGIVIALIGFLAQYSSETVGQASIVNTYALIAFLATGFVSGAIYWLAAGRFASAPFIDEEPPLPEITRPSARANGKPAGTAGTTARAVTGAP